MATTELDRDALRRAHLRSALRRGDIIAAARAWERLRVDPAHVTREERAAARAARAQLGRAIRDARWRRIHSAVAPIAAVEPAREVSVARRRLRRALALAALVAGLLLVLLSLPAREEEGFAPAAAPPEEVAATTPQPTQVLAAGRGRTTATLAPVVAVTAPPQTLPPETPPPASAPVGTPVPGGIAGGQAGGVPGGVAGGVVGGVVGGTGTKTLPPAPTATPTPQPTINILPQTPPPLESGFDRITFRVVDSQTLAPLSQTCVVYGTADCGPDQPHTNVLGYYWIDFDRSRTAASLWDFRFFHDDYLTARFQLTYTKGQSRTVEIRLRPQ